VVVCVEVDCVVVIGAVLCLILARKASKGLIKSSNDVDEVLSFCRKAK
jgi:hypothetical protein